MQLNLFSGEDGGRRPAFKRAKNGRKTFNSEEIRIIEMRKNLKTNSQIGKDTHYTSGQIQGVLRSYFKNGNDPLHKAFIDQIKSGCSLLSTCRKFQLGKGSGSRICKRYGVVPPGRQNKRKYPKKHRDNKSFAEDCYCFYRDGMSVRDIARSIGYSRGGIITTLFNKHIPGYAEESKKRRESSNEYRYNVGRAKSSKVFRYEKDFQEHCCNLIGDKYIQDMTFENFSYTPDLGVFVGDVVVLVELKVSFRKKDSATALGQALIYVNEAKQVFDQKGACGLICVPDDVSYPERFEEAAIDHGVVLCHSKNLLDELDFVERGVF